MYLRGVKKAAALALPIVLAWSPIARAEEPPFSIGPKPAWFVSGGVTTGGTIVATDRGYYLGGELSLLRMREGKFVGLYGDGYYDFGAKRTYTTGGIELGYKFIGLDGGVAARLGGRHAELGPTGRLFFTLGIVTIYGRYAYFAEPNSAGNDHVVQIGGMLKLPFAAWGGK